MLCLAEQRTWEVDRVLFRASWELRFWDPGVGYVTRAGGWVGNSLIVAGGYSGGGKRCSISLSGVVRSSPACGAAGGESGSSSQIIDRLAAGVFSVLSCPLCLTDTAPGFACQSSIHGCFFAISASTQSFSNSECPEGPEVCNPDTVAIGLELASTSICEGIFGRHVEGPGSPSSWRFFCY